MPAAFFWLALFPMFLGGVILWIFIIFLRKEGQKTKSESRRLTPKKFIDEVARYSNIDNAKAERIIEFVFSYFPGFNWRKQLPTVKDMEMDQDDKEKAKKS